VHACWVDWRQTTLQTTALLALAGALEKIEPDAHAAFADAYAPPPTPARLTPEQREQRRQQIARLAGA
jgi:hypothetical protein